MQFRHPAAVIDEVIADLEYLSEFLLDDIDHRPDEFSAPAIKAVAALEASRVLLPRLRVVRSNYTADARLPDGRSGADLLGHEAETESSNAGEVSTDAQTGVLR